MVYGLGFMVFGLGFRFSALEAQRLGLRSKSYIYMLSLNLKPRILFFAHLDHFQIA